VLILTDENFDEEIEKHDGLLVMFYAPWCGHCKILKPIYAAAAEILAEKELHVAKLDATVHTKSKKRFKIGGFPALKFIRDGEATTFKGQRSTEAIIKFVKT